MARIARQTRLSGLSASLPSSSRSLRVGIGKQRDAGDVELGRAFGVAHRLVDRKPLDARHGGDRRARSRPIDQEQRPDQVVGGEHVLAHQPPRPFGLAVAARPNGEIAAGFGRGRCLGLDRRQTGAGFDRAAVFDGHCGDSTSSSALSLVGVKPSSALEVLAVLFNRSTKGPPAPRPQGRWRFRRGA